MKQWILNTFFQKEVAQIKDEVEKNAWTKVMKAATDDVLATFNEDVEERATELMEEKLASMLSPTSYRDVISFNKEKGIFHIEGERIDEGRLSNLRAEAQFLLESDIWNVLQETPKSLAEKQMFVHGETLVDLQQGKTMLYLLSQQKNILWLLKNYRK